VSYEYKNEIFKEGNGGDDIKQPDRECWKDLVERSRKKFEASLLTQKTLNGAEGAGTGRCEK